jgi:hypothetical protein
MQYSVWKINFDNSEKTILYEFIDKIEDADLLAQFAMCNKDVNELIFICAGNHRGINRKPDLYEKALQLAEEYKSERRTTKMNFTLYDVVLTNGTVRNTYRKCAMCQREAIILAQADAINSANGYDFVSITEINYK